MDGIIILARLDSSRFPNKAITPVGGKRLIQHCIDEAKKLDEVKVILATSARATDDPLEEIAEQTNIQCYRGDLNNVAKRVLDCIIKFKIDSFARVNGDSPFIKAYLLKKGFQLMKESQCDLVTNLLPRRYPYGVSVEVFRGSSFQKVYPEIAESQYYSEHISSIFYDQKHRFNLCTIPYIHNLDHSNVHLTVDTVQDKELIDRMFYLDSDIGEKPIEEVVTLYHRVKSNS